MLALSLILFGILLRFIPHAPNFTPVAAIALFGAVYLNRRYALLLPLFLMMISDIFIGFHDAIFFTWGSFMLVVFLGFRLKEHKNPMAIISMSLLASVLFFLITNFGVWVIGWYPRTLEGLISCYVMALPFFRNFTLSTLCYVAVLFSAYELIAKRIERTKLAKALLNK